MVCTDQLEDAKTGYDTLGGRRLLRASYGCTIGGRTTRESEEWRGTVPEEKETDDR